MTEESNKPSGIRIDNFLVAFIDLLGHAEKIKAIPPLFDPDDQAARSSFLAALKQTYGTSLAFEQFFKEILNSGMNEKVITYRKEFQVHEPRIRRFSDAVVIDLSLGKNFNRVPMDGVLRTLITCAGVMLGQLSVGQPIRGGIDIGVAIEVSGKELFGPVAVSAYHLESKEADYPRIVVGKALVDYLQWWAKRPESNVDTEINRQIASRCFPLLVRDTDGKVILDYLGPGFRTLAEKFLTPIDVPRNAYEFVLEQAAHWQGKDNAKLARRYALLRSYFTARMPDWEKG